MSQSTRPTQRARDAYLGRESQIGSVSGSHMADGSVETSMESSWIDVDGVHTSNSTLSMSAAGSPTVVDLYEDEEVLNDVDDNLANSTDSCNSCNSRNSVDSLNSEGSLVVPMSYGHRHRHGHRHGNGEVDLDMDDIDDSHEISSRRRLSMDATEVDVNLSTSLTTLISGKAPMSNNNNYSGNHSGSHSGIAHSYARGRRVSNLRIISDSELERLNMSHLSSGAVHNDRERELERGIEHENEYRGSRATNRSRTTKRLNGGHYNGRSRASASNNSNGSSDGSPFFDPTLFFIAATSLTFVAGISFSAGYALGRKSIKVIG